MLSEPRIATARAIVLTAALLLGMVGCGGAATPSPTAMVEPPMTSSTVTTGSPASPRSGTARPTGAAPSAEIAAMEREVVERINAIRQERDLQLLATDQVLSQVARDYSCLMARRDFFRHTGPDGDTVADRVRQAGKEYHLVGENLARNTNAPDPVAAAVEGWMASAGHRENILRAGFTETGVGVCREGARYYFTQIFMQPR